MMGIEPTRDLTVLPDSYRPIHKGCMGDSESSSTNSDTSSKVIRRSPTRMAYAYDMQCKGGGNALCRSVFGGYPVKTLPPKEVRFYRSGTVACPCFRRLYQFVYSIAGEWTRTTKAYLLDMFKGLHSFTGCVHGTANYPSGPTVALLTRAFGIEPIQFGTCHSSL